MRDARPQRASLWPWSVAFDMMPLFLKLQFSHPLSHVCTRRVSPSLRLCTKSHAVRPCSPFSTCAPSTLSPLYLCAAAVPGNHPRGHCCTWPLLPSIEGYPQGARRAAQLVTCSARVPRTRSLMLLCGPLDLAASQGAYALQPRVLRDERNILYSVYPHARRFTAARSSGVTLSTATVTPGRASGPP